MRLLDSRRCDSFNNKFLSRILASPSFSNFSVLHTLAIGLEIKTTFPGASLGFSIALPSLAPVARTK
jgi:hypothetical protein